MSGAAGPALPTWLERLPGVVCALSADGRVRASNGRLEAELGRSPVGEPFVDLLDAESSCAKWERLLAGATTASSGTTCELILAGDDTLPEPRAFTVLWDAESARVWLVEHPRDGRLDALREQVVEVNSELTNTQRDLLRERARLAHALDELEGQYREQERLSRMLQAQKAEIEARNAALLATTGELHARQQELERSNRALDEFAHAVSHDLKAPLRSIANYAQWIEEDAAGTLGDEAGGHLTRLRAQVTRMRALIDGILDYARAGRERSEPEPVDVGALVREILQTLDPPDRATIVVDEGLPTFATHRAPLRQVLQNLIENALVHARRDEPRVHVTARLVGAGYEFAVADNGPGIPARQQARIWTLFHTAAPDATPGGTGIGLAIVRRLVEAHGGRAWVDSAEDVGATFRFLWPADSEQRG
jgi:signal transduction histidine kinase